MSLLLPLAGAACAWGLPLPRTAHVSVDGQTITFTSLRRTVGDVLGAGRIVLRAGDRVIPAPATFVWPGMQISVVRAIPVALKIGGAVRTGRVAARTVGEALGIQGISVGPLDRVYPGLSAGLVPDMRITVERREWRTWTEQRAVPYVTQVVRDADLFKGNRLVRSPGQEGMEERTVRVLYADGRPALTDPLAWTVAERPSPRVVAVGIRPMIAPSGPFAGREFMILEATAYYPGPLNYGGGVGPRTAIGMLAQRGVVAVDPSVIPLGSHLYVEGYGNAIAGDTGGAIQGYRIDLCYNTYDEAIHFGRRPVKVYLLDKH